MRVVERAVYRGPHLYSHTPMIRIQLDLGGLEALPTHLLGNFTDRLIGLLPTLHQHGCSLQEPGGLIARMREGTWLGHVIEHVALELQSLAGMPVARGKTRSVKGQAGIYNVMFEYREEGAGVRAARCAIELVSSLLEPPFNAVEGLDIICAEDAAATAGFELGGALESVRQAARATKLGPTTRSIVDAAVARGIPWQRLDEHSLIQLGTGRFQKRLRASITGQTSHIGVETAGNKDLTKQLLANAGVPVPKGLAVRSAEEAVTAAAALSYPVVLKPLDGNHGRGVTTGITSAEDVRAAFELAVKHSRRVVVEHHLEGRDHRILVIAGEIAAVAERIPAHVVGNGRDTVAELIAIENTDSRRGEGHEEVMTRIVIDEHLLAVLSRAHMSLDFVPAAGQTVWLRETANLSTGGTAVDRTDEIHPDNALAAIRAASIVGLDVAGIDLVIPDITRSWREVGAGIVEVNAAPGFRMHLQPSVGSPRNVAENVVSMLFPPAARTTVPLIAITGTNGKSTTVRMVAHILRQTVRAVGFTSTSGIFINDQCLWKGDASGPQSARALMRDPTIDFAVLETARGGILREGLGFDHCAVGAVLNVAEDHLGIKGINTVQDLADLKSVVTESVSRRGVSVLNGDDPLTRAMARHAGGRVCFFSALGKTSAFIAAHIAEGGLAVTLEPERGEIVIHAQGRHHIVLAASDIPATHGGAAHFNTQNALAATAIAYGAGIDIAKIRSALATFASTFEQNPGRFNIHDDHGFRVVMDYAHNPAALTSFLDVIRHMRPNYRRLIGTISAPGDRREADIREMGRIAARDFDLLVFRELPDNRGRPIGEVVKLLREGALTGGCPPERIVCVYPEEEANALCLGSAEPGDLVVLTPTKVDATWQAILDFKSRHANQTIVPRVPSPGMAAHA